ncbi:twin-arginine translocation signal domain-containing protein, partial [bacterium]|nr:twin-arginine translocation signal domain-containing protein [bacterium]
MSSNVNRRKFLQTTAAAGAFTVLAREMLGGPEHVAPSERVTLAHIGMGTQGFNELGGLLADPAIQIVAVCDPNTDSNDYIEWG